MSKIRINTIRKNPSLCDGFGYRTILFLQGCNLRCKGCQNKSTWDVDKGYLVDSHELAEVIRKQCLNKKLTISGGEPLLQADALIDLLEELKDFDLCLYTGHQLSEVPADVLKYLRYIKTGPFVEELRTTVKPFVGSTNQEFLEVKHDARAK